MALPTGERRCEPRRCAAYSFWYRRPNALELSSAWLLNVSNGGAAFLATPADTPVVGEKIELEEMYSANRLVQEGAPPLPRHARVLRVEDPQGATRRVAVRFEAPFEEAVKSAVVYEDPWEVREPRFIPNPPVALTPTADGRNVTMSCRL